MKNPIRLGRAAGGFLVLLCFPLSMAGCNGGDTSPPETTLVSTPEDPSSYREATFTFDCDEEVCVFECRLDSGEWTFCTTTQTYTGLSDGSHTFEVRATDGSENVDPTPAAYTWTVSLLWANAYGGDFDDVAASIRKTGDRCYLVSGGTYTFGYGDEDAWVMKLESDGTVAWERSYGGLTTEWFNPIRETGTGEYIAAGSSAGDVWVVKLDADGWILWQKVYGGADADYARSLECTRDGGYVITGSTESFGSGLRSIWTLKLDAAGEVEWQKTYGDVYIDYAYAVTQTFDGGYAVAGGTESFGAGGFDLWILRLDSGGSILWQKTYGGAENEYPASILETEDGRFLVVGASESFAAGGLDAWLLLLDSNGGIVWQKAYGGGYHDFASAAVETNSGGFVVVGGTESFGAGHTDAWVLRLTDEGTVVWEKTYGGDVNDQALSVQQTDAGGYIFAGTTESFGAGGEDAWIVKVDVLGEIEFDSATGAGSSESSSTVMNTDVSVTDSGALEADTMGEPVTGSAVAADSSSFVESQTP